MITEVHGCSVLSTRTTVRECAVVYAWEFGDDLKETLRTKDLYDDLVRRAREHGEARISGRVLLYKCRTDNGGESCRSPSTTEAISFLATPCHFGGVRVWFQCPGTGDGENPCGKRVGALYLRSSEGSIACRECLNLTYECRTRHREFTYEHVSKPAAELRRVVDRLNESDKVSSADIVDLYEAERDACLGVAAYNARSEQVADRLAKEWDTPEVADPATPQESFSFQSFETWVEKRLAAIEQRPTRAYGRHGRCTATAKTANRRCRQPAIGEHGKCYYHGGVSGQ